MAAIVQTSIYDDIDTINFKSIDRSNCDDDTLTNLKINMQKEIYCFYFIKNLVDFYFKITQYIIIVKYNTIFECFEKNNKPISDTLSIEFNYYQQWIESIKNTKLYNDIIQFTTNERIQYYNNSEQSQLKDLYPTIFYNSSLRTMNLYDDSFNSLIILQKLLGIEITFDQLFNIISYYIKKLIKYKHYFNDLKDPIHNTRGIVINNEDISINFISLIPMKDSNSNEYNIISNYIIFDEKFKNDIVLERFQDGYPITTQEKPTCKRYIVQLCKDDDVIMSMTIAGSNELDTLKTHFYIFRHTIFDIKSILKNQIYRDLSIYIHSFAAYIFNTSIIFSALMESMKSIFNKNGIKIEELDNLKEINNLINCSRNVFHKIYVNDNFKQLWLNHHTFTKTINGSSTIYKLNPIAGGKRKKTKNKSKKHKKNKSKKSRKNK
jgi:hypothetical protein